MKAHSDMLDLLFRKARTQYCWTEKDVPDSLLRCIWDLCCLGSTSANASPMRIAFIISDESKERLRPLLAPANVEKCMKAPVVALFGYDMAFYDKLPQLFPHTDARSWFVGKDDLIAETAFRNGTLQAAYFMMAARAMGLDCGAISGFDLEGADRVFFADTRIKSNFLCNFGYGSGEKVFPRSPRLRFEDGCQLF